MAQTRAVRSRAVSSALHLAKKQACPETAERACPETADRAPPRAPEPGTIPHGTHQTAASEQQANDNQTDRSAEEGNNRIRSYQSEA